MKNLYGIWIDHTQAFVMKADEKDIVSTILVASDIDARNNPGSSEGHEHNTIANQSKQSARKNNEMHHFARKIIAHIANPEAILIFGPSTAKIALKEALDKAPFNGKVLMTVQTADKMTENQLRAYVREFFELPLQL